MLRRDPSSAVAASFEGWEFPMSREALILADLYDLTFSANSDPKKGRPKPHPGRPWKQETAERQQVGNASGRSREEVRAIMRRLGHRLN